MHMLCKAYLGKRVWGFRVEDLDFKVGALGFRA